MSRLFSPLGPRFAPCAFGLGALLPLLLTLAPAAHAQDAPARRPPPPTEVRVQTGWAAFVDDALLDHAVVGSSVRVYLTPRLSVEPELTWMRGPGDDRDLVLLGNLTFDIIRRPARVSPYLTIGGGLLRHTNGNGFITWSTTGPHVAGGPGVTFELTPRASAFVEWRLGFEPHTRVTAGFAYRWSQWRPR
jgi:hypothetical protein